MEAKVSSVLAPVAACAALWAGVVLAADLPAARPGDEALTCEQIFAQGSAEKQREQEERARKVEELKAQQRTSKALLTTAVLTGGLGGSAQAAQHSVDAGMDKQTAMSAPPPANPRMERLRQLWEQKHCVKK
ncbi:MAG TPA: hypothetical protein VGI48_09985 [Caldimonas sp.]|jgi:hypothetical protein